jgi:hypothetical protein
MSVSGIEFEPGRKKERYTNTRQRIVDVLHGRSEAELTDIESNKEKFGTGTRFRNMVKVYDAWKNK